MTDDNPIVLELTKEEKTVTPTAPHLTKEERERLKKEKEEERERLRLQKLDELKRKEEEKERLRKEREEEKRKKDEERERLKKEKEDELKRKEEEKERLRLQREEEKRKKDEEKEKQRIERLEKERKRLETLNAKIEEKKRKEEEKLRVENEKHEIVEKKKQQFFSYFIKKDSTAHNSSSQTFVHDDEKNCRFLPFQCKPNMYLPPIHRRINFNEEKDDIIKNLDQLMAKQESSAKTYLMELRDGSIQPRTYPNTVELNNYTKECIPIELATNKFKVKFLLFDPKEHRRPPYYGTWRKRSTCINSRKPFAKDTDLFDYEVNSDEEWEDEPDGESIASSKNDDEDDLVDDEDDDDGFFVPHGHLSDDEIDEENRLPEQNKEELERIKREQYENERKKNSNVLVPKYVGCVWDSQKIEELVKYKMVPLIDLPISLNEKEKDKEKTDDDNVTPAKPTKHQKQASTDTENLSPLNTTKTTKSSKQATTPSQKSASKATTSIIKFMSRKKDAQIVAVPLNSTITTATNTNDQTPEVSVQQSAPSTPQQSVPEKRVHSDNDNGCVKRLRLDKNDDEVAMAIGNDQNNKENEDIPCILIE